MSAARYRKPRCRPRSSDNNPFVGLKKQPYFGELPLPPPARAQETASAMHREYLRRLAQLYCPDRQGGPGPVQEILDFLRGRGADNIYILWGACGIGKSWFLRHLFLHTLPVEEQMRGILKVIDLRHVAATTEKELPVELYRKIGEAIGASTQDAESSEAGEASGAPTWIEAIRDRLMELQESGTRVCLALDNADMFPKQEELATMVVSLLGQFSRTCFVIIPLRPTTKIIAGRLSLLHQSINVGNLIAPVDLIAMLGKRFAYDENGNSLADFPIHSIPECPFGSFPELWEAIRHDHGIRFLLAYAGTNARACLDAMQHILHSRQMRSAEDLRSDYHFISALMLSPQSTFDPAHTRLLNLFDNDNSDPSQAGVNALIRLRILEYFVRGHSSMTDTTFEQFLELHDYHEYQVREIVDLMLDADLIRQIEPPISGEGIRFAKVTELGRFYYDNLIYNLWYVISIERGMIINEKFIRLRGGFEEVDDLALADYVREEEEFEAARLERFKHGHADVPDRLLPSPISAKLRSEIMRQRDDWRYGRAQSQRWGMQND